MATKKPAATPKKPDAKPEYRVIVPFVDFEDGNYLYSKGEKYPRNGAKPIDNRIDFLLSTKNRIGKPVIEKK